MIRGSGVKMARRNRRLGEGIPSFRRHNVGGLAAQRRHAAAIQRFVKPRNVFADCGRHSPFVLISGFGKRLDVAAVADVFAEIGDGFIQQFAQDGLQVFGFYRCSFCFLRSIRQMLGRAVFCKDKDGMRQHQRQQSRRRPAANFARVNRTPEKRRHFFVESEIVRPKRRGFAGKIKIAAFVGKAARDRADKINVFDSQPPQIHRIRRSRAAASITVGRSFFSHD